MLVFKAPQCDQESAVAEGPSRPASGGGHTTPYSQTLGLPQLQPEALFVAIFGASHLGFEEELKALDVTPLLR